MRKTKKECEELHQMFVEYFQTHEVNQRILFVICGITMEKTIANYEEVPDEALDKMFECVEMLMNNEEENSNPGLVS